MAATAKIIEIGDSLGIILPEELLARLKIQEGDVLALKEFPGGIELITRDEQIEAARKIMRENRYVLKRLAE